MIYNVCSPKRGSRKVRQARANVCVLGGGAALALTTLFFIFFFYFSHQLILQSEKGSYSKNYVKRPLKNDKIKTLMTNGSLINEG